MDIPTIKWTYRNCDVEITVLFDSQAKVSVTPVVEIDCHGPGLQALLTTGKSFLTIEQAEEYGEEMAREWIDEYRKRREEWPARLIYRISPAMNIAFDNFANGPWTMFSRDNQQFARLHLVLKVQRVIKRSGAA